MRFCRPVARIGAADAQGDRAVLNELPQSVQFLVVAIVSAHERRREANVALRRSLEPAHRREGSTVAHGVDHFVIEHRPVGKAIDARGKVLANALGDVRPSRHHDVRTERPDQITIGLGGVGNHGQPLGFGKLNDIAAVGTGSARHRQHIAAFQAEQVERQARRQPVHRQRACLDVRCSSRGTHDGAGIKHDLLAVAAVACPRNHHAHHRVADLDAGFHPGANLIDDAGDVHAWHVRWRINFLLLRPCAVPRHEVRGVDGGGMDAEAHLARTGVRFWHIYNSQHLWTTVLHEADCAHGAAFPAGWM